MNQPKNDIGWLLIALVLAVLGIVEAVVSWGWHNWDVALVMAALVLVLVVTLWLAINGHTFEP